MNMSPEFWNKVKDAFGIAIELAEDDRQRFVAGLEDTKVRQKVQQMIAEDEKDKGVTNNAVVNLSNLWGNERQENLIGAEIGSYRIVREIGRGGMGVAFEVTHTTEDVVQQVALKILRRGMDSEALLRSFQNERRILASLEHQHIVRLLGAGVTDDGLPYYTMELVDGKPLDEYVRETDLDLEARLNLFQQICSAIAYAHGKFVVHRDLKPSNVLVTPEGSVKLLDFGIAKDISLDRKGEGTATKLGIMTPRYASPEQIRGESVNVASDVYSLGVILYELLTGVLPYKFSTENPLEIARIISEAEPQKPSEVMSPDAKTGKRSHTMTRNPQLKGDLDTIIIKALQKVPSRRYASVEQFSNDISRYLNGLPITARPDTFRYRTEKFIKRNRLSVGAAGFMFLALLIGASIATWQAIRAERQRAFVIRRFDEIRIMSKKAVFRWYDEIAKFSGSSNLREELVTDGVKYMDSLTKEDLDDVSLLLEIARSYRKIGDTEGGPETQNLGKPDDALKSYKKSATVMETALKLEPNNVEVKKELINSLLSELQMGTRVDKPSRDAILQRSQQLHEEIGSQDSDASEIAKRQANILIATADPMEISAERQPLYQKAFDLLHGLPEKNSDVQLTYTRSVQRLGSNYIRQGDEAGAMGDNDLAATHYKRALDYRRQYIDLAKTYDGDAGSPTAARRVALGYQELGEAYIKLNDFGSGFENLNLGLSIFEEYVNRDPENNEAQIDASNCYFSIANAYKARNDPHRSSEFSQKSIDTLNRTVGLNTTPVSRKIARMYRLVEVYDARNQPYLSQAIHKQLNEICSVEANSSFCKQ